MNKRDDEPLLPTFREAALILAGFAAGALLAGGADHRTHLAERPCAAEEGEGND